MGKPAKTAVALGALAAVLVAGAFAAFRDAKGPPRRADRWRLSELPAPRPGTVLVGTRTAVAFYRVRRGGRDCWTAADAGAAPSRVVCPRGRFPSASRPILDLSPQPAIPAGRGLALVSELAGTAADEVVRVALLAGDGSAVVSTLVAGNVYAKRNVPAIPVARLVALDARGRILYSECVRRPSAPCRP